MPYERKLPFVANSYMPFGEEAYERGRHYVHIWKPTGENRWKFRIYRYGKPKSSLVKIAKDVLSKMQAPLHVLGQVGATPADWGLWVQKVLKNKYNYTWTEFYFSEHNISPTSPWSTKGVIKGPLWADIDPLALIDMRIYDRAEQEYKNTQEYERRIVAEDWLDSFFDTPGQVEELRDKLYSAIKNAPLGHQVLCENCYRYNPVEAATPSKISCQYCGKDIDTSRVKKTKKTLTYNTIKDYLKTASLRFTIAQTNGEYWIAILGDGTKLYNSEESLLSDIRKEIDKLSIETIAQEALEILEEEMPSIEEIRKAVLEKFGEMEHEQEEEEYALVASLDKCKQILQIIESIDSKGFNKEARYLKEIILRGI